MNELLNYLPWIGLAICGGIIALILLQIRKPQKKEMITVQEKKWKIGEGPRIEYDVGLGGSPYCGWVTGMKTNFSKMDIELVNEDDGALVTLTGIVPENNLKLVSNTGELMQMYNKFRCNKDSTGEVKTTKEGANWAIPEKDESRIIVDAIAKARARAEVIEEFDDIIQYKGLRIREAPSRLPEKMKSETEETTVDVSKFGKV